MKQFTMQQFIDFVASVDSQDACGTVQSAIEGGATHIAVDGNGDVFAYKMRPRQCEPDSYDSDDYLGEWLRGAEEFGDVAKTVCYLGNTGEEHPDWRELCYKIPRQ